MKKILVADDAKFMRMMIKDPLTKNGYTDVVEAEDGEQAIEKYKEQQFDFVIMDVSMPNLDGLEALKVIKGIDPGAMVVIYSKMGKQAMLVEASKSGAKDFLVKPFKPERILQTVRAIIG